MGNNKFYPRSKIWLEDAQGNVVFGLGRYRILKTIEDSGSLSAAAKNLKMGYKAIWARIRATEERLGQNLLIKTVGGPSGGGSKLTPLAKDLISRFEKISVRVEHKTDLLFEKNMKPFLAVDPE